MGAGRGKVRNDGVQLTARLRRVDRLEASFEVRLGEIVVGEMARQDFDHTLACGGWQLLG